MKMYNELDLNLIMDILNSYNEKEFVPSGSAWSKWSSSFFWLLDHKGKDMTSINLFKDFKENNDFSEESFKKCFPYLNYSKYTNPMSFNSYNLSQKEKQRISMLLQEELPLSWDKTVLLVNYYYMNKDWNFESLTLSAGMVDPQLQASIYSIKYLESKGITKDKKAS